MSNERRVVAFPEYRSDLGDRLFPRQPTDGFFERELRSQFAEMLASCSPSGASVTVQELVDFAARYVPRVVWDCSPRFRAAIEARWRVNQAAIVQALMSAHELGHEIITSNDS